MRSEQDVNSAIGQYADMVQQLCMVHLKNEADSEDIFQTVFLKYALSDTVFESEEHKMIRELLSGRQLENPCEKAALN